MLRKIGVALFCAGSLLSTTSFSTSTHTFQQGMTVEYELPTNEPQVFSNIFFWTIKASCTIISETPDNPLAVKMLRKSGSVNDMQLSSGDSVGLTVQAGEKLSITAESGAKVELLNLGEKTIRASCISVAY